jgi:phenylalanyl-tRNA synthetase beta chain
MQFPESWLRQFCNPQLSTQQMADTLTMAGLEVEDIQPAAPPFSGVVVAAILEAHPHPNADRLRVCTVDIGQADHLLIVCGAPNARPGIRVPCAVVGAALPAGADGSSFRIKLSQLRGVESQGMLCSAKELHLSDAQDGLLELASDAPLGMDIRKYLNLDDALLTLKLTPNLAHCLSIRGVARELSALTGVPLAPLVSSDVPATHEDVVPVTILAPELCGRFSGRLIKGLDASVKTPTWMVDRLARCGQRSVNALVDISNYVMFELGQPTHIFDSDKLHGGLTVRWANSGEELKLLNGNVVNLDGTVGVIADDHAVESLAGIMGGDATAVSDGTKNVYVEAAFWWPKAVAGRSRRYNFSTDAGHRFERGVDPQLTLDSIEYITHLILDICGGSAGPVTDQQPNMPVAHSVKLRIERAERVIGMPLGHDRCKQALLGLGLTVVDGEDYLQVTPPSYRFDLQIEEDLIEEIARVVGYENLPATPPHAPVVAKRVDECKRNPYALRRLMAALGYQETINFSFVDAAWERDIAGNTNPIQLLNPIASHMGVMRSTLLASLLNVLKFNVDRKTDRVCVFELGRVFLKDPLVQNSDTTVAGFDQPQRLGGLVYGPVSPTNWEGKVRHFDFYDVKGHVESLLAPLLAKFVPSVHPALHPGRSAQVLLGEQVIGHVGELHPKWRQSWGLATSPVLFELELDALTARRVPSFIPFSKHQAVERDVAVWVAEAVTHADLMAAIHAVPLDGLLRSAVMFDLYRPKTTETAGFQEKSVAIRLTLQRDDAALTEKQIEEAVAFVVDGLISATGARQRT